MEIDVFCQLLIRLRTSDGPLPTDARQFCAAVRKRLPELPHVYDPLRFGKFPPLDIDEVERLLLPPFDICKVLYWLCRQAWQHCRKKRQEKQLTAESRQPVAPQKVTTSPVVGVLVGRPETAEQRVTTVSQASSHVLCQESNPDLQAKAQASQSSVEASTTALVSTAGAKATAQDSKGP